MIIRKKHSFSHLAIYQNWGLVVFVIQEVLKIAQVLATADTIVIIISALTQNSQSGDFRAEK